MPNRLVNQDLTVLATAPFLWQYRIKIVRHMRSQIFCQIKQKAREYFVYSRAFL